MSYYRTRTYIAGDWDNDKDLIDKLYKWNDDDNLSFSFSDAHKLMQARDTSLYCSIKRSLSERLNASKTFLLVVGEKTTTVTKGQCRYCGSYSSYLESCRRGYSVDNRSFIQYECEKAVKDNLNIIVVYNYAYVDKSKCPEILRQRGIHINGYSRTSDGIKFWNRKGIADAVLRY